MTLHPRLYSVDVKNKSALISVDTFHPSGEKTILWWSMARAENGPIVFMAQPAIDLSGEHLTENAGTVEEVLERLREFTTEHYGPLSEADGVYVFGLEFI